MKRICAVILALLMLGSVAYAESWDDIFGGLNSLFSSEPEVTYGVGEEAVAEDVTIKLINVMQSNGSSMYKPEDGKEYLILEFEVLNNQKDQLELSTMLSFTFWCDDEAYTIDLEALALSMFNGKYQLDTVVEADQKVTGVIGYMVPKGWEKIRVEFKPELLFGETVNFVVEK